MIFLVIVVHTQIYGTGRMQKFLSKDFNSIYEDVLMAPGFTHDPFAGVKDNDDIFYGWHQYYSDSDCIWMAIEYHPAWKKTKLCILHPKASSQYQNTAITLA